MQEAVVDTEETATTEGIVTTIEETTITTTTEEAIIITIIEAVVVVVITITIEITIITSNKLNSLPLHSLKLSQALRKHQRLLQRSRHFLPITSRHLTIAAQSSLKRRNSSARDSN